MTIGIYSIVHTASGKRYIGKSKNVEKRMIGHKHYAIKGTHFNRHLKNAVVKYGWSNFHIEILEQFESLDEDQMKVRELHWIDLFDTTDRRHGYNLRKDSSTNMVVHQETRELCSSRSKGKSNPNFGNRWTDEMKQSMSETKKKQHASGKIYGDEWRKKQGTNAADFWRNNPSALEQMSKKVAIATSKYRIFQYSKQGNLIKVWDKVSDIVDAFPEYKRHNIYAVCSGEKPSMYGYIWRKEVHE